MSDRDQGVAFAALGCGALEDDAVDVGGVDGGGNGDLADMTEGGSLGVDNGRPHEGGDACPLISVFCHRLAAPRRAFRAIPHVSVTYCSKGWAGDGLDRGGQLFDWEKDASEILTFEKSTSTLPSMP